MYKAKQRRLQNLTLLTKTTLNMNLLYSGKINFR